MTVRSNRVVESDARQHLINEALNSYLGITEQPVTQELVRKIVREELAAHG